MKYKYYLPTLVLILFIGCKTHPIQDAYIFTTFMHPESDGLRIMFSNDGYKWQRFDTVFLKSEVGGKILRDPSITQSPDGTFHLVWTTAWRKDLGFGYASSKDLVHWGKQQFIPVMSHDTTTVNVWAPEIFFDDENEEYIVVWASTVPYKFERGIESEHNNHRLYYSKTKDFKDWTPSKIFFDPGYSVIDGTIVKRGAKDYVLVFKDNTRPQRNILVAFGSTPLGPFTNISKPFTQKKWGFCEGPTVLKTNKGYLIYFDAYEKGLYGGVLTTDFIHFENITKKIFFPPDVSHGTVLKVNQRVISSLKNKSTIEIN